MGLRFVALSPSAQQLVFVAQHEGTTQRRKRAPGHPLYRSSDWLKVRKAVLARDNYECQLRLHCCRGRATSVDHIVPRSEGGSMLPENLVAACGPCNSEKKNRYDGRAVITVNW